MTFSEQLREKAAPVFEAIFQHPFVQGIGKGEVCSKALIHYVKADFEYLNAFVKAYGMAISRCTSREEMAFFSENIAFVFQSETLPHRNFCRVAGVDYESLQGHPLPPSAHHYVSHLKLTAREGSLGEIMAALLPCPWTYAEIGSRLMVEKQPDNTHPFYDWISFYSQPSMKELTDRLKTKLDACAAVAGIREKARMEAAFITSCHLEWRFWDMAYRQENWPLEITSSLTEGKR